MAATKPLGASARSCSLRYNDLGVDVLELHRRPRPGTQIDQVMPFAAGAREPRGHRPRPNRAGTELG